jgi:ATP-dependent helicase/nuclease subunit B
LITWQASQDGDPNPLSPWLELLDALHRMAYGDSLKTDAAFQPWPAAGAGTPPPRPRLDHLPATLSASAWQSLVACPYQFWARYGLALREQEEVPEEPEKRDYGERVHAILHAFHRDHPRLSAHDREELARRLEALSRARFAPMLEDHYLARAWLARWLRQVPGYVDWALAWEQAGHAWLAAEQACRVELEYLPGRVLGLVGRVDRLDLMHGTGEAASGRAVLDYKTQSGNVLRRKLKSPGDDVQLPFYALLTGAAEAAFVALDDKEARAYAWPGDVTRAARAESGRIAATWRELAGGAPLPAQGAERTCQWCEMRGLCRRDYWTATPGGGAD